MHGVWGSAALTEVMAKSRLLQQYTLLTSSSAVPLRSQAGPSPRRVTSWVRVSTCALRCTRSLSAAARSACSSCTCASLVCSLACAAQQTVSALCCVA